VEVAAEVRRTTAARSAVPRLVPTKVARLTAATRSAARPAAANR